MKVEVLISCMFQDAAALIARTNIQSDVLVINQCDTDKYETYEFVNNGGALCTARIFHTKERGLSRSRNMAIRNASGELCLICDDDEVLQDDYVDMLNSAFAQYPDDGIIVFRFKHPFRKFSDKPYRIGYFNLGMISSYQMCLRRDSIPRHITFCEKMGSGTGNGGGEENKFVADCLKSGVHVRYVPTLIGSVAQVESKWFHGFDKSYWVNRGWGSKMVYGRLLGYIHIWYTLLVKSYRIDKTNSWFNHFLWLHKGFAENR